jgi:competence protein ComEA
VVCGLFGAGVLFLLSRSPRGDSVQLRPPPTPPPVVIHVSGAVRSPGVYSLAVGARVQEALEAAGGVTGEADLEPLNLAAFVEDGERVWVPECLQATPEAQIQTGSGGAPANPAQTGQVNINTARQDQLESLPGIGPVLAQAILAYRQENGPFEDITEIQEVSGIGPAKFEAIEDLITVEGGTLD